MNFDTNTHEGKFNLLAGVVLVYVLWNLFQWCGREGMLSVAERVNSAGAAMRKASLRSDAAGDPYDDKWANYLNGGKQGFMGRAEPPVFPAPPSLMSGGQEGLTLKGGVNQRKLEDAMLGH